MDERQPHIFVQSARRRRNAQDVLAGTHLVQGPGFGGPATVARGETLDAVWTPDGAVDRLRGHDGRRTGRVRGSP